MPGNDETTKSSGGVKGDETPKSGLKGGPGGPPAGGSAAVTQILHAAGNLCGFLVVAVVAPIGGGGGAGTCAGPSAQKLALAEVRRKAELRDREAQNGGASQPEP
jgi:hypothetical protein